MENRFEHIEEIIAKYLAGQAGADEISLLNEWRSESAAHENQFGQFRKLFEASAPLNSMIQVNTDAAWEKVKNKISQDEGSRVISINRTPKRSAFLRIAASIILIAGISFALFKLNHREGIQLVNIETLDSIQTEILPDGSSITINKQSTIAYSTDQFSKKRIVHLKGEAFFDVKHNETNPFTVEAGGLKIVDVGTSFNIQAIENAEMVIISVVAGEVKITNLHNESLTLMAGEEGHYNMSTKVISKADLINPNIAAYATRVFIFENAELITVMKVLNEVYETKITSENDSLNNCRITVTFNNESIEEISEVIAETLGLKLKKENNKIIFSGNVCK